MRFQIIVMVSGAIAAVIIFFSSRYVRVVLKESIARPRETCKIEIGPGRSKASVTKIENAKTLEG